MWPPVLIDDRTTAQEIAIILGGPVLLGALTGWLLGVNETAYLVVSVLAIAGGYAAGMEHAGAIEGFYRGLIGGLLFGTTILLVNGVLDEVPKADLPDPSQLLVVITTVSGVFLGALGGRARQRREVERPRSA